MRLHFIVIALSAALGLTFAIGGAHAGSSGHKTFCTGGAPTQQYICDHLKAADAKKPTTTVKQMAVKK